MSARELITEHLDLWTGAVTQKSTRGRGRSGKVELTGIKRLRELILELAIQGKLVIQNPDEEAATTLFSQIVEEKAQLIEKGTIKKPKKLPQIEASEIPFRIPGSWKFIRLGDAVEIIRGITFPGSEKSKSPAPGRIACLRTSNVQDKIEFEDMLFIRSSFVSRKSQYINTHDIVMSMANSRELVGKVAIIETAPEKPTSFGGFLGVLRPIQIHPRYLMAVLRANSTRNTLIDSSSQTTNIANISIGKLNPLVVGLPPREEQHRIVQKVDELMALCDRLEQQTSDQLEAHETLVDTLLGTLTQSKNATELADNWARLATHFDTLFTTEQSIDKLKQTILQLAVMGRLVEQGAGDTPPSALLEKISSERLELAESGKIKLSSRHAALTSQEPAPFAIRTSWHWTHLESLFAVVTDGDHQAPPKSEQGIPFLVIGNLNAGEINFTSCKYVSEDYFDNLDWSRKPTKGDLLYTVTGSYGIPIKVDTDRAFCVQRHVAILKATDSTPRDFIKLLLASEYGLSYADNVATGIAQKTVPLSGLRKMPVPLPPVQEQHRIVQKVDELMALCDQLKERLNQAGETRCQLAEAVVDEALN